MPMPMMLRAIHGWATEQSPYAALPPEQPLTFEAAHPSVRSYK